MLGLFTGHSCIGCHQAGTRIIQAGTHRELGSAVSTSSCHTQLQSVYSAQDGVDPESGAWIFEVFVVLKMDQNRHFQICVFAMLP